MKRHSKYIILVLLFATIQVYGQFNEDNYKQQADEIRDSVWNWKLPAFKIRTVPAGYEKYSKVILARRVEINCLAKAKLKLVYGYGFTKLSELTYTKVFRELVKINDAAALDYYSEVDFQKFKQNVKDKHTAFLGFRIIKPDGSIKEINPDEIVLTEDKENNKKAKLAVPDLQVGDIVDYFIESVEFYSFGLQTIYDEFEFAEENPILYYSVHLELNNKLAVQYRSMNGAPDFNASSNDNDDIILDAEQTNISPMPVNLWLSHYRQVPVLRIDMRTGFNSNYAQRANTLKLGQVYKNPSTDAIFKSWKAILNSYEYAAKQSLNDKREKIKALAKLYFQNNGGGNIDDNSLGFYYAARHLFLLQPDKKDITAADLISNYDISQSAWFLSILQVYLDEHKFDPQFIILPSRYGPRPDEAMYTSDFRLALLTKDNHIYTAETVFDLPDQVPYYLDGQQGIPLYENIDLNDNTPGKGGNKFKSSTADQNVHTENLVITFNPLDAEKIKVDRKTVLTGHTKLEQQRWLLLYEDYYEEERRTIGISESVIDELNKSRKGQKIVDEYKNAFLEARKQWKENFKDEIERQFDTKPDDSISCNVVQAGIFNDKPDFVYTTQFAVNDWIKTAGNNYILEVGKITTPRLKLTLEQRDRNVDLYMPYARTFQYNLRIPLPQGYIAEGLDKLNSNLKNATGSFISSAKLESDTVLINVTQTFNNTFEKVAQWPQLLSVLDAATAFEDARILLKKL